MQEASERIVIQHPEAPATHAQRGKIYVLFREKGHATPRQRGDWLAGRFGVAGPEALNKGQASEAIEQLLAEPDPPETTGTLFPES